MENPVRTTTLKVVKRAEDVKINQEKIEKLAKKLAISKIVVSVWPKEYHLQTNNQQMMLDYLILLDALNFCFWNEDKRWNVNYKGKKYNGYFALSLALKKFFGENSKKASLEHFSKISFKEFKEILQGGKNLLFLKKRWQIARTVSSVLIKKYKNSVNFVNSANHKLSILVPKIQKELPSFNDVANYNGKKVYFLKRAQILGSDIWGALDGGQSSFIKASEDKRIGYFKDLDYLTAFADYKIPQILYHFGILEYSDNLERKIGNKIIIPSKSKEEIEIRSATIWAVEYLKEALTKLGKNFHSFQIDWILWNKSQKLKMKMPYHLTKTIFY